METWWQKIFAWFGRAFRSRYVRLLETEVERLRAENRALVNSLLGTAGFPPLDWPGGLRDPVEAPRVRRHSWPQYALQRELEAARQARPPREPGSP